MTTSERARRRPQRLRLAPFKILSLLLYGEYPWLHPDAEGLIRLELSQMARDMRLTRERCREQLTWLHTHGYLRELELGHGWATIRLQTPPVLDAVLGAEREAALRSIQKQALMKDLLRGDHESQEETS